MKLKPCPFCGSESKVFKAEDQWNPYYVICKGCKAKTFFYATEDDAELAWNRRTDRDGAR